MSSGFKLVRTKSDAVDDPAPNATLPAETAVWHPGENMPGFSEEVPIRGVRSKLVFTTPGGNTATVEIWKRDDTIYKDSGSSLAAWSLAGTVLSNVPSDVDFINDEVGAADLYFRLRDVSGGNPISVYAEPVA